MKKQDEHIFIKILLLAFLLLLVYSWFTYHIYNDMIVKATGAFLTFWALVSFLLKYQKKDDQDKFRDILSQWLSAFLNYKSITVMYILFFFTGSFVSSVHIYARNTRKDMNITLYTGKDTIKNKLTAQNPEVDRTILTTPFGKNLTLKADGYQRTQIRIFPWTGKRIVVENDLKVSPTLIVRIPEAHFLQLAKARISIDLNGRKRTFETNKHALLIIGQVSEVPEKYCNKWLNELRANYEDNRIIYQNLNNWCDNPPLFIPLNIGTYDSISICLISRGGDTLSVCKGTTDMRAFKELRFKNRNE